MDSEISITQYFIIILDYIRSESNFMDNTIKNLYCDANSQWLKKIDDLIIKNKETFDTLSDKISIAYKKDKDLKDGYSKLGLYALKQSNYQKAKQCFEKDFSIKKATWKMKKEYLGALFYSGTSNQYESWIKTIYDEHPEAQDAYATIALLKLKPCPFRNQIVNRKTPTDYHEIKEYFEKDKKLNKLSLKMMPDYIRTLALLGLFDDCHKIIDKIYNKETKAKDLFSNLAMTLPHRVNITKRLEYFEKDFRLGQMTDVMELQYMATLYKSGQKNYALRRIEKLYSNNSNLVGGYAQIALLVYLPELDIENALKFLEKDKNLNRLRKNQIPKLIYCHYLRNGLEKAKQIIENFYDTHPDLSDLYCNLAIELNGKVAKELFEKDFSLNKATWSMKLTYIKILFTFSKEDNCKKWLDRIHTEKPSAFDVYGTLGFLYEKINNIEKAISYYEMDFKKDKLSTYLKTRYYLCLFKSKLEKGQLNK